jgi:hypothetical protein
MASRRSRCVPLVLLCAGADVLQINTLIRPDGQKKAFVRLTPEFPALEAANRMGFL